MIKRQKIPAAVSNQVKQWRREGLSIGFVPTMGYLHEGHQSLIEASVKDNDKTVVSIFVNPMQFGPQEDLAEYPRDFERDSIICERAGAALIFYPEAEEMYGPDFSSYVDVSGLTERLCGASRPGHFRGVCTVVTKLFHIVQPDKAYFGEKDAQQLAVIRRMVMDLNMDIEVIGCPIVREEDGLAKSSRNIYLNGEERKAALCLSEAVLLAKKAYHEGQRDASKIVSLMKQHIGKQPLAKPDYISVVDALTLQDITLIDRDALCAVAVYIGKTRLIDNITLRASEGGTKCR